MLELRYYQKQAIDCFFEYTRNNHGKHPLVVLPTGSGKSLIQAHIVKELLSYPDTRILLLTHQIELIKQNVDELINNFDNEIFLDIGVYSAGLDSRDTQNRILFAGIQSVHKRAHELGFFDIVLVDECHRINSDEEGTYRKFLSDITEINNNVVIAGLSATPFRMKTGLLTEGKNALFDDVCYNCSIAELIDPNHPKNLDKKQYLCNIISKNSAVKTDLSKVKIRGGEFVPGEMERAFNIDETVSMAVKEIIEYTEDRKKVLIFTAGIDHAENVYIALSQYTDSVGIVHSKLSKEHNEKTLELYRNGGIKYLVNVDILTTGFNQKNIDCIAMMRATMSPGLYSQIAGRGLRMAPGKTDCLFLDYGGNILRHGPIDKIEVRRAKNGSMEIQTAPMKECPKCGELLFLAVMTCPGCGYEYPIPDKHDKEASEIDILSKYKPPKKYSVIDVSYSRHSKKGKPDSLRVDYEISVFKKFSEWVCIEHEGYARKKAEQWMRKRIGETFSSIAEFFEYQEKYGLDEPIGITVNENNKFPEIIDYHFETIDDRLESLL